MNRIGSILDSLPRQWPARAGLAAAGVAWRLTAGAALSAQVEVESWRDGVLQLRAQDASGERQVISLRGELLRGLNQRLGAGAVRTLRVVKEKYRGEA